MQLHLQDKATLAETIQLLQQRLIQLSVAAVVAQLVMLMQVAIHQELVVLVMCLQLTEHLCIGLVEVEVAHKLAQELHMLVTVDWAAAAAVLLTLQLAPMVRVVGQH